MPLNLPLPDWVPWWGQLVILIGAILFGFAFLMMPFSVFGLKGRLDFLEAQLDDIHAELRMIATRLPDPDRVPAREPVFEELVRPPPTRSPSPVQVPRQAPEPAAAQMLSQVPFTVPPPSMVPPRATVPATPPFRAAAPAPPRFNRGEEQPVGAPQRFPSYDPQRAPLRDSALAGDWDDEQAPPAPRRPLRATTLRDPARDIGREQGSDRSRSEPTLRWPPR